MVVFQSLVIGDGAAEDWFWWTGGVVGEDAEVERRREIEIMRGLDGLVVTVSKCWTKIKISPPNFCEETYCFFNILIPICQI